MNVLVYIEAKEGKALKNSLELLAVAKELGEPVAVCFNQAGETVEKTVLPYGVKTLAINLNTGSQEEIVSLLLEVVNEYSSGAVLFGATQDGKDVAPRVAARLSTGCVTDVISMSKNNDKVELVRPAYGGSILETMSFADDKVIVATIRSGSFSVPEVTEGGQLIVKESAVQNDDKVKLIKQVNEITEMVDLEGAEVIVAGGRGCGTKETFELVKELASLLNGVVGASRPAIEEGWVSRVHQIGQSGKIVAPKIYIACGISGAMQHLSGVLDSNYIIAINKDEEAPIFEVADISIVGRCEDILPAMIETIKAQRA